MTFKTRKRVGPRLTSDLSSGLPKLARSQRLHFSFNILSDFRRFGYYMGEMQTKSDAQLLRAYAERGAEAAFTELVHRHTDLVYSAAWRQVESPDLAREIAQGVFISLARGAQKLAPRLADEASLAGWLCRSARNQSLNHRRDEFRRQTRERHAMEQLITIPDAAPDWEQLRRVLDDAMAELEETDYDAVVLRYFQNRDFQAVGAAIGVSDDTAQKRVARALEKLRELLAQRGIRTTAGALGIAITANAVTAAPVGLAATISAAVLTGTSLTLATIAMTILQKIAVTAALTVTVGAGIYEAKQASDTREENKKLQTQQASMVNDLAKLRGENEKLTSAVTEAKNQQKLTQSQFNELMKLRGQTGQAKTAMQELAKAQTALKKLKSPKPGYFPAAMATSIALEKKMAAARVARMKTALNLSDAQVQSITNIMFTHIDRRNEMFLSDIRSGNITSITNGDGTITQMGNSGESNEKQEDEINAQLSPDQVTKYDAFKKGEEASVHDKAVSSEAAAIATEFSLTPEQQQQIQEQIAQSGLDTINRISTTDTNLAAAWLATGDQSIITQIAMKQSLERLTNRLNLLKSVLKPAQLEEYRQEQQTQIEATKNSMSTFPPRPSGAAAQ